MNKYEKAYMDARKPDKEKIDLRSIGIYRPNQQLPKLSPKDPMVKKFGNITGERG